MAANKWMTMMLKDEKNLQASAVTAKERVQTESPSLNWALSGGLVMSHTTCFYGPEGSGKSLLSMMAVGSLQQSDTEAIAVIISTEMRAPSPEKLIHLGVDPERVVIRQANEIGDVFDWITSTDDKFKNADGTGGGPGLAYMLGEGAPIKAMVIDSIKGIRPPKELNAETVTDAAKQIGDISKALNPALRSILGIIRKYNVMTIFVQQVNENQNADEVKYQNKKYIVPSGMALKHFCETMCLVERVTSKDSKIFDKEMQTIRDIPVQRGHTVRVRVEKSNLDAPFREAEFQIDYLKGVVNTGDEVARLAISLGVIYHPLNDKGSPINTQWVFGEKKWIGSQKLLDDVASDPELQGSLMRAIADTDKAGQ
jgi:recombination protein RecA